MRCRRRGSPELLDEARVLLVVDQAGARPGAALDVVHEARAPQALVADELAIAAAAHRERAQQQVEGLPDGVGVGVGPEVAVLGAPARAAPPDRRPGPLVPLGQHEERVALVVTQPHVEARLVLLDEAVLEHERLDVVADLDPLDALGRGDHLGRPRSQAGRVLEVVGQPLAQRLRLTDVYDPPVLVAELVRARGVGDAPGGGRSSTVPVWRNWSDWRVLYVATSPFNVSSGRRSLHRTITERPKASHKHGGASSSSHRKLRHTRQLDTPGNFGTFGH